MPPTRRAVVRRLLSMLLVAQACGRISPSHEPRPDTGSTQTLTSEAFGTQAVARVEELFVGRFPGVEVFSAPGGVVVRIRGSGSVMGDNEPLFVVDGTPLASGTGGLLAINPRDVARIEVLKDAASTAEYGLRGGNGVIRVTTKRR